MSAMAHASAYITDLDQGVFENIYGTLRAAVRAAEALGQGQLAGELHALGCYLGNTPIRTERIDSTIRAAERYREAVMACLRDVENQALWQRAEIRFTTLTRQLDALHRHPTR